MKSVLYYTAPSDEAFNELMEKAIEIWKTYYNDTYGYVTEKLSRLNRLQNVGDNFMTMKHAKRFISDLRLVGQKMNIIFLRKIKKETYENLLQSKVY